jgi:4-hydroxy-tetrahydrodipicolinate synthase
MDSSDFRGVFAIVTTPFTDDLRLDERGLRDTVEFSIEAGARGVVAPANASEVAYLSDAERRRVAEIVVETAGDKVASVVGVSSSCATLSVNFARHAAEIGADALMAMPPCFQRPTESEIRAYYNTVAAVTPLPIILQHFGGPGGTPMSPALVAGLLKEVPTLRFLKEETDFSGIMITEIIRLAGTALEGVMGGKAGKEMIDEFRRGACGTMPACEVTEVHVAIWSALERSDFTRAKEIFTRLLPLISFGTSYGPPIYKEVLRRRGIISSSAFRQTGGRQLDATAHRGLDEILEDLRPYMTMAATR